MGSGVRVDKISRRYGETTAVHDISFDAEPGEFLALLGPSGCGKTTTLRIIAGLTSPSSGRVLLDEKDVVALPPYDRDIGMVFQNYALFPHMSVAGNVAFGLEMRGGRKLTNKKRVAEMLELVRLPELEQRAINDLSGGQQQRVALARALAPNPQLLLLDEPLSNLDLKLRQEMRSELKRIQRTVGVTTIFVTHDQGEALSMADRIVVINQGRVEQIGSPGDLYSRPKTKFVAMFLGDINTLPGNVEIAGKMGIVRISPDLTITVADVQQAVGTRVEVMIRPEDFSLVRPESATEGATNLARGIVEDTMYLGALVRLQVRAGSLLLTADISQRIAANCSRGAPILLGWAPEVCNVVSS